LQAGATVTAQEGGMDPQKVWLITKPYFEKALTLDPNHAGTHIAIAWSLLWFEWDFEGAGIEYQKAKKILPNYSWSDFLVATGNFEEAVSGAEKNAEINPNSTLSIVGLMTAQYYAGHYREVLQTIKLAMQDSLLKENLTVVLEASRIYMYLEKYEEALQNLRLLQTQFPSAESPRFLAIQSISEYHLDNRQKTMEIIDRLKEKSNDNAGGSPSFYLAMIYCEIGEIERAFEWLEKSYQDREVEMYWLKVEPPFEPIRSDPRYQEMLAKVGFPD
jgi:tetratricopeptide (TPR) repeat protein